MAAAAQLVNPNADVVKKGAAAMMNINAARGLQDVLSSNLGPKGTLKMVRSRGRGSGSGRLGVGSSRGHAQDSACHAAACPCQQTPQLGPPCARRPMPPPTPSPRMPPSS